MPLTAIGWTSEEEDKLVNLVQPHSLLYNVSDPSRKNILARESTWKEIAQTMNKPVEECKKRWRGLRDGYTRSKRMGAIHKTKVAVFEKLQFLDGVINSVDETEDSLDDCMEIPENKQNVSDDTAETEQEVITDNQEYYEITVLERPQEKQIQPFIKILPKLTPRQTQDLKTISKKPTVGRKRAIKAIPVPTKNIQPIKILPKPIVMNGPKIIQYVEDQKVPETRTQTIDNLIERILKENTNEIDVFFRSMAASVKKLPPHMIPKVKMEVCNVIAKYEMQSFDKV